MSSLKTRLDQLLVARGIAPSQTKAKALIMAGVVFSGHERLDKAGKLVSTDIELRVTYKMPFVSRSGEKLERALVKFAIDVQGLTCLDIGASTGGFTDCLLQRGAKRVIALDVGRNLIDSKLKSDPRLLLMEERNARFLTSEWFGREPVDLVSVDVSFISVLKLCGPIWSLQPAPFLLLMLIKPQFEVGRGQVGKGGIVRDEEKRRQAIQSVCEVFVTRGFEPRGLVEDILKGAKGNQEAMAFFVKPRS